MDLLLTGGLLADGTGALPGEADLLIREGRVEVIAASGALRPPGVPVRDVSGSVVSPGFIDLHTHSDLTVLSGPRAPSKAYQGVTTEVVGNCGLGVAPLTAGADISLIRESVSYLDLDPAIDWTWRDTSGYLDAVRQACPSINIATLTAHIPLRAGTVGFDHRAAGPGDIRQMKSLLAESFAQGSVGLSTGLVYAPLCYATDDELTALGGVVAVHDRVFTWHVRDYGDDLIPSVRQALDVAERTGCRTQISHLAAVGRRNWGMARQALDLVDEARTRGADVGVDIYPYLYGNAPLAQLLPSWVQEGGAEEMKARLLDDQVLAQVREAWTTRAIGWDEVTVSWVPPGSPETCHVGRTIADIASTESEHRDGDSVALGLLAELGMSVLIVAGGRSEDDLRDVLDHPAAVVASDGLCLDPDGVTGAGTPHPRSYGCFPRYLSRYTDTSPESLARAISRITSAPARIAGLRDRGVLRVGVPADIVVFSAAEIADTATFVHPQQYPAGIDLVLVSGEEVIAAGRHTGRQSGKTLAPYKEG